MRSVIRFAFLCLPVTCIIHAVVCWPDYPVIETRFNSNREQELDWDCVIPGRYAVLLAFDHESVHRKLPSNLTWDAELTVSNNGTSCFSNRIIQIRPSFTMNGKDYFTADVACELKRGPVQVSLQSRPTPPAGDAVIPWLSIHPMHNGSGQMMDWLWGTLNLISIPMLLVVWFLPQHPKAVKSVG